MSANYTITATGTGTTAGIQLSARSAWVLQFTSSGWGVATIESSADGGANYVTVRTFDDSAAISLTANRSYQMVGGLKYRLNVSSYSAAITMVAQPVST